MTRVRSGRRLVAMAAASLAVAAAAAQGPSLRITSPTEGTYLMGSVRLTLVTR